MTNVTEKCGEECPAVAQSGSALGISVSCQKPDKCLEEFHYVVKACYNTTKDYPPKKFSRLFCPYPYGRPCPEIKESKYKYHECYDIMNWPGQYRCLNRGDLQEQAFQKRLGSTTHQGFPRTNANMLISSTNETHFTCGGENQTYRWDTACDHKGFGDRDGEKFCSFPNGAAIRLGYFYLLIIKGDCVITDDYLPDFFSFDSTNSFTVLKKIMLKRITHSTLYRIRISGVTEMIEHFVKMPPFGPINVPTKLDVPSTSIMELAMQHPAPKPTFSVRNPKPASQAIGLVMD